MVMPWLTSTMVVVSVLLAASCSGDSRRPDVGAASHPTELSSTSVAVPPAAEIRAAYTCGPTGGAQIDVVVKSPTDESVLVEVVVDGLTRRRSDISEVSADEEAVIAVPNGLFPPADGVEDVSVRLIRAADDEEVLATSAVARLPAGVGCA